MLLALGACQATEATVSQGSSALCPGGRIVAVLTDPSAHGSTRCTLDSLEPGWQSSPLFDADEGELGRYCAYTWHGAGPAPLDRALAVILDADELRDDAAPDCTFAAAQGELDPGVAAALLSAFRLNTGWVSAEQLGTTQAGRAPVEVAIIDTAPRLATRDPGLEPLDPHGELVHAIISDLACPGGPAGCRVALHDYLGLPRPAADRAPDQTRGGHLGSPVDVALAIVEAIEDWAQRGQSDHLIINLSLGWPPPTHERAPEAALRSALEVAACRGALVFAAAGNDPDAGLSIRRQQLAAFWMDAAPEPTGPLLPASLESVPAPDVEQCRTRHQLDAPSIAITGARPLVFAVGGVDEYGRALANTKPGARPRLAATAAHGLAPDPEDRDGGITRPLTGSSIAAAVASGAAALVWSYRPDLDAGEVVELLYSSGWDSEEPADFGLARGESTSVHELSVCAALQLACATTPGPACPVLTCGSAAPAADGNRGLVRAAERAQRLSRPETVRVHRMSSH